MAKNKTGLEAIARRLHWLCAIFGSIEAVGRRPGIMAEQDSDKRRDYTADP
jgi:hypothetical protein